MASFKAATQYDDVSGTCVADLGNSSLSDLGTDFLELREDERIVGVSFYKGEGDLDSVRVECVIFKLKLETDETVDGALQNGLDPKRTRVKAVEMTANDFFKIFKRFNLTLSRKGNLENKDVARFSE